MKWTKIIKCRSLLPLLVLSVLCVLGFGSRAYATFSFPDCEISGWTENWLQNAKDKIASIGYNPSFTSNTNYSVLVKTDGGGFIFYIGDDNLRMQIDSSYGLQYGTRNGSTGYMYRAVMNTDGTAVSAARLGGFTSYPASEQGLACVQGVKNLVDSPAGIAELEKRFPCYTSTFNFGDATNSCPVSSGGTPPTGGGGTTDGLTLEQLKELLHNDGVKAAGFIFACAIGGVTIWQFRFRKYD